MLILSVNVVTDQYVCANMFLTINININVLVTPSNLRLFIIFCIPWLLQPCTIEHIQAIKIRNDMDY